MGGTQFDEHLGDLYISFLKMSGVRQACLLDVVHHEIAGLCSVDFASGEERKKLIL